MSSLKNISFKLHLPMEFLYSLFATGTDRHFFDMIHEFDLEPNAAVVSVLADMKRGLSRFMDQELRYFFDLSGLGYILYKNILLHPEITDVPAFLELFNKIDSRDLLLNILKSTCKSHMPEESTKEYEILRENSGEMRNLVDRVSFQDEQRRSRVLEAIENPEEIKQRLNLLLSQFYSRCFAPFEKDIINLISTERSKFEEFFSKSPEQFIKRFFNLESVTDMKIVIHLSFFKYAGCHHYSLYSEGSADWFILGIYSSLLFSDDLSSEKLSSFFKSLSDPNRIEILKLLSERPWFGQELAEKLNITPATISYHMAFLQKIGAVSFIRADNRSYYSLNSSKLLKPMENFITYFKKDDEK